MRKRRNVRKEAAVGAAAAVLVLGAALGSSLSYFTTYTEAAGARTMQLAPRTEIREEYDQEAWVKSITVTNTGNARCYVRADIFAPDILPYTVGGEGWVHGDRNIWYYSRVLEPGETTPVLAVDIEGEGGLPEELDHDFTVTVVEYCAPVLTDEEGNDLPYDADGIWYQNYLPPYAVTEGGR